MLLFEQVIFFVLILTLYYMSPRIALLLLLASSCGSTAIAYEAECGLLVEEGPNNPPLTDTVACQRAAVKHGLTTCALMQGVHVQFMPADRWVDAWSRVVYGLTFCPGHKSSFDTFATIQVGNVPAYEGSLIHEFRHLQECPDLPAISHENWSDAGIYQAIRDARADAKADLLGPDAGSP